MAYATGNYGSEAVNVDYLTDKITDTKTELINKGLKFNADNNDVKTNKLGSTVTVSGDANITTKITQTGDDSTIEWL